MYLPLQYCLSLVTQAAKSMATLSFLSSNLNGHCAEYSTLPSICLSLSLSYTQTRFKQLIIDIPSLVTGKSAIQTVYKRSYNFRNKKVLQVLIYLILSSVSVVQRRYTSYTGESLSFLLQFHICSTDLQLSVAGRQR